MKKINVLISTFFGNGYISKIPGTFTSLSTLIILYIFFEVLHFNNLNKIIKNPLKKKLNKVQLLKFAKNCEYIIAGTENYDKDTINKLTRLKCIFRLGSGTDNVDIDHLKKKKIKFFKSITTPEIAVAELVLGDILSRASAILSPSSVSKTTPV